MTKEQIITEIQYTLTSSFSRGYNATPEHYQAEFFGLYRESCRLGREATLNPREVSEAAYSNWVMAGKSSQANDAKVICRTFINIWESWDYFRNTSLSAK